MVEPGIAGRARFDDIRYAQVWEDADILVAALGSGVGRRFLSICSAGDNVLALLLLDPREVVASDLSAAQLECLALRVGALRTLAHGEFLELMGARPSRRRGALLARVLAALPAGSEAFWRCRRKAVERHGAAGIGRFERYFRLFRRSVLPLIHRRASVAGVFVPRDPEARSAFFDQEWDNRRWRIAGNLFFSRFVMGRLGRDPAFFAGVEGSVAAHVRRKARWAATAQDPSRNPYLRWILTGTHGDALPLAWREESWPVLRERADRIRSMLGPVETAAGPFDGFNLSDIFEYMTPAEAEAVYARLLASAAPGARLVYWNMMVPRRVPAAFAGRVRRRQDLERRLAAEDKAFFYSELVIEELTA
jgi:S-adenosylmethionine-diacylglycerol 3-amino-3-carboxypropyl transferase